ncbi:unnamed protein product (mitochondrion) [Plasmodiophora brassicae]|uniref:Protein kinase domain-containing protein n=1 Tax=Plasmodiophora brassicae TaxID=37360 RepID=A0A3P3YEF8_PLABS|nr:unnamed protein product [Plasmodiophora brassicae]
MMAGVVRQRALLPVLGLAGAAIGGAAAYVVANDEGLVRSTIFWTRAMPVYGHYRAVQWWVKDKPDAEQDEAFNALHDRYAHVMEKLVYDLRGFYMKLAQIGSTRDEFLPKQYMDWAKRMQDEAPSPMTDEDVRHIIERELQAPIESVFDDFDFAPIGCASIGQVHKAKLKDGRPVAIKVQIPGIEAKFRNDIATAKRFCEIAQPAHLGYMNEIEKQFLTEFDYRREAENMALIRKNILPVWGHKVDIPEPYLDLCTTHMLVMELMHGRKLIDGIRDQYKKIAKQMGKTLHELEDEQRQKISLGVVKPQSLWESWFRVTVANCFLTIMDVIHNTFAFTMNQTAVRIGLARPREYRWSEKQINLSAILNLLLTVHAHQIFIDGAFNGDPHPGNIMLLKNGKVGLIDFGQVKHISKETRLSLARLIKAIADEDRPAVLRAMHEGGYQAKNNIDDITYRRALFFFDRDSADVLGGLNLQMFMEETERVDPITEQDDELVMASRVSLLLRGLGNAFNIKLRVATVWKPFAERCIRGWAPVQAS